VPGDAEGLSAGRHPGSQCRETPRGADGDGKPESRSTYVEDLNRPFGLAFYPTGTDAPTHVYIANTDSVVRDQHNTLMYKSACALELAVRDDELLPPSCWIFFFHRDLICGVSIPKMLDDDGCLRSKSGESRSWIISIEM
jgi:hypothetical protein